MYNDYNDFSFDQQLNLNEESIRRQHNQQMFLRRSAQLLQQELELEAEILEENPELAQAIHQLELQSIHTQQQGLKNALGFESVFKPQNIWNKFFPGLSEK